MASNISEVVTVLFQLKEQGKGTAEQITAGLTKIIDTLEALDKKLGKDPFKAIEKSLPKISEQAGPATEKIKELGKNFRSLASAVTSASDALSKLKIPESLKNLSINVGTVATEVKASVKPKKTTKPAEVTADVKATQEDTKATQENTAATEQNAKFSLESAQASNQEAQADSKAADIKARHTLAVREALIMYRVASEAVARYNQAVAQGATADQLKPLNTAALAALRDYERAIKVVTNSITALQKVSNEPGIESLIGRLTKVKDALIQAQQVSVSQVLPRDQFDQQKKDLAAAERAVNSFRTSVEKVQVSLKDQTKPDTYQFKPPEQVPLKEANDAITDLETKALLARKAIDELDNVSISTAEIEKLKAALLQVEAEAKKLSAQLRLSLTTDKEINHAKARFEELEARVKSLSQSASELQSRFVIGRLPRADLISSELIQGQKSFQAIASEANTTYRRLEELKGVIRTTFKDQSSVNEYTNKINELQQSVLRLGVETGRNSKIFKDYSANVGIYGDILRTTTKYNINSLGDLTASGAGVGKYVEKVFANFATATGVSTEKTLLLSQALNHLEDQMVRFRSGVVTWSIGLLMMSTAIAAPFREAILITSELSDNVAQAGAVTNATAEEFRALEKAAYDMGRTTRFTAIDASKALVQLGRNGFTASESIALLPTTLQLAAGAAIDLGEAADIVTNIMTAFRLEIDDFSNVADVLTKAVNSSNATLQNLGFAFTYVGSLAKGLGSNFNDLIGALSKLHDAGFKGTMAGTALRGALDGLFNPTKQEAEIMGQLADRLGLLGFNIKDAQGNFIGWVQIVKQLEDAAFTSEEALKLFGQRAGPGIAALLKIGSAELERYVQSLNNSAGTTQKLADVMGNTLKGRFLAVTSAFQGLAESFGKGLEAPLKALSTLIADAVNLFTDFRDALQPLTAIFDALLASATALAVGMGTLTFGWFVMYVPVKQLNTALSLLFGTIKQGLGTLSGLPPGIQATTKEVRNLANLQTKIAGNTQSIANLKVKGFDYTPEGLSKINELRTATGALKQEYINLKFAIERAAMAQMRAEEERQAARISQGRESIVLQQQMEEIQRLALTEEQAAVKIAEARQKAADAGRAAAEDFRAQRATERAMGGGVVNIYETDAETRARIVKETADHMDDVAKVANERAAIGAARAGMTFSQKFSSAVKSGFERFVNSGAISTFAILASNFFTRMSAEIVSATVAMDVLIQSTVGWEKALGYVKKGWEGLKAAFLGLNPILRAITITLGILTLGYYLFRDSTSNAIKSTERDILTLKVARSELENLNDTVNTVALNSSKLGDSFISGTEAFAKNNNILYSTGKELLDISKTLEKSGVKGLEDKLVKVSVRTDVKGYEGVQVLTATLADGSVKMLAFAEATKNAKLSTKDFSDALKAQKDVLDNLISENTTKQIVLYSEKIKEIESDIGLWESILNGVNSVWFDILGNLLRIKLTLRDIGNLIPGLRLGDRIFGKDDPEETLKAYLRGGITEYVDQLIEVQANLSAIGVLNSKDSETLDRIIAQVNKIDSSYGSIVEKAVKFSKGLPTPTDIGLDTALKQASLGLKSLRESLKTTLTETEEVVSKLITKLKEIYDFNKEAFETKTSSIKDLASQNIAALEEAFAQEGDIYNKSVAALRSYGKDRTELFRQLGKDGIQYEIEDYNKSVELAKAKADVNVASYQKIKAAFYEYYIQQRTLLSGLADSYSNYGESAARVISSAFNQVKPAIKNLSGSISTELTTSFEADGKTFVIPTIVNGIELTKSEAIDLWKKGFNKEVIVSTSKAGAEAAAQFRSNLLGQLRGVAGDARAITPQIQKVFDSIGKVDVTSYEAVRSILRENASVLLPWAAQGGRDIESALNDAYEALVGVNNQSEDLRSNFQKAVKDVSELSKELVKTSDGTEVTAKKAVELLNELDLEAQKFLKDLTEEEIDNQKSALDELIKLREDYIKVILKLEKDRVKQEKALQESLNDIYKATRQGATPKVDTSKMSEEQKLAYERKQRVLKAQEFEREQAAITLDYYRALGNENLDELDAVAERAQKLVGEVTKAVSSGDVKLGLSFSGYDDIVSDASLSTLVRTLNAGQKALRDKFAKEAEQGAAKAQTGIEGVNAKLIELRNYLSLINESITTTFGEKGPIQGFTDQLGNLTPEFQKVAASVDALTKAIDVFTRSLEKLKTLDEPLSKWNTLDQGNKKLEDYNQALNEVTQSALVFRDTRVNPDKFTPEQIQKASDNLSQALQKLSQNVPGMEAVVQSLKGVEGIDQTKLETLAATLLQIQGFTGEDFTRKLVKGDKKELADFIQGLTDVATNAKVATALMGREVGPVLETAKNKFLADAEAMRGAIDPALKDALGAVKNSTNLGDLALNINPVLTDLGKVQTAFNEIIRLRNELNKGTNVGQLPEIKPQDVKLPEVKPPEVKPLEVPPDQFKGYTKEAEKASVTVAENLVAPVQSLKQQVDEKINLVIDAATSSQVLDSIISKLKEIIEWIKTIGKTPLQINQQGTIQVNQTTNVPSNTTGVNENSIPVEVKPVLNKQEVTKTVTTASKILEKKPVGLAITVDERVLSDQTQIMEEFNRQQAKAGGRQLDLEKIPKQIQAAGKSFNQLAGEYNKVLEETGANWRVEPFFDASGTSYKQQMEAMIQESIKSTPGFKIPVEFQLQPEQVKIPEAFGQDYVQKFVQDYFNDITVKASPKLDISQMQLVSPLGEDVFQKQINEFFKGSEIKPDEISFNQSLLDAIAKGKEEVKPGIPVPVYPEFTNFSPEKLKNLWITELGDKTTVGIPIQPVAEIKSGESFADQLIWVIEEAKQNLKSNTIKVPVYAEGELDFNPTGVLDAIRQTFTNITQEISKIDLGSSLKLNFDQQTLKNQLTELVQSFSQTSEEIISVQEKIKASHVALFENEDSTQIPIINDLTAQLQTLEAKALEYEGKINEISIRIQEHASKLIILPEDANPLGSIIAAVTAGKDALLNSVNSIVATITGSFTPIINQVKASVDLGILGLNVQPAIDAITVLIALLQQAITLTGQLGTIPGVETTEPAANAAGGYISGPGTSTSDSILSWLSNGEYVSDAYTTKFFGPGFFKSLKEYARKGIMPSFKLPKFAAGGLAGVTENMDYNAFSGIKITPVSSGISGTPVVLNIYDKTFQLSASNDVAAQLRKVLSIENLKRGRK